MINVKINVLKNYLRIIAQKRDRFPKGILIEFQLISFHKIKLVQLCLPIVENQNEISTKFTPTSILFYYVLIAFFDPFTFFLNSTKTYLQ